LSAYYNEFDEQKAAHVGRLRGYGDAIVAPVAQAFIESFMETEK
jgi:hypothetical protein